MPNWAATLLGALIAGVVVLYLKSLRDNVKDMKDAIAADRKEFKTSIDALNRTIDKVGGKTCPYGTCPYFEADKAKRAQQ